MSDEQVQRSYPRTKQHHNRDCFPQCNSSGTPTADRVNSPLRKRRRRPKVPRRKDLNSPDSLIRRMKANLQERLRMHRLNTALEELRRAIPRHLCDRRLSKIKTLRLAIRYISALDRMVNDEQGASCEQIHLRIDGDEDDDDDDALEMYGHDGIGDMESDSYTETASLNLESEDY